MQLSSARKRRILRVVSIAPLVLVLTFAVGTAQSRTAQPAHTSKTKRIAISLPGGGATLSGTVTLRFKLPAAHARHVRFKLDGRAISLRGSRRGRLVHGALDTTSLSDGPHRISATASYRSGKRRVAARGSRLLRTANASDARVRSKPDRQAPSAPAAPQVSAVTAGGATLTWRASTDNVGVASYDVYLDGKWVGWSLVPSYTIAGLTCGGTHSAHIVALDAARNYAAGKATSFRTKDCAPPPAPEPVPPAPTPTPPAPTPTPPAPATDSTPPSAPSGLAFSSIGETTAALSWNAATDNVGVASYDINVNGKWFDWSMETSHTITGLNCATSYSVYIIALDSARNYTAGQPKNLTTAACGSTQPTPVPTPPAPEPTPPTPPSNPGQPSGVAIPSSDAPGWKLIFADDFTKDAALGTMGSDTDAGKIVYTGTTGTKWVTYPKTFLDTYQKRPYRSDKVLSVHDGTLDFYLHPVDGQPAGANPSPVITGSSQYQTFGRYSARIKVDDKDLSEYYMAWLLWPYNEGEWQSAESDYPEGQLLPGKNGVSGYPHYGGGKVEGFHYSDVDLHQWHTITQDWTPLVRRYYVDDKLIYTTMNPVYQSPQRWQLQTETNTWNVANPTHEGHLLVDWVAVYSYSPGSA